MNINFDNDDRRLQIAMRTILRMGMSILVRACSLTRLFVGNSSIRLQYIVLTAIDDDDSYGGDGCRNVCGVDAERMEDIVVIKQNHHRRAC